MIESIKNGSRGPSHLNGGGVDLEQFFTEHVIPSY